jgi:cysteine desulfurase family protein (TIGR01976 family)
METPAHPLEGHHGMAGGGDSRIEVADVETIRSRFPSLERRQDGTPVAYFDGPGGTQVPVNVVRAMADYLFKHNANTHWRYPTSVETDAALADARATLAEFLGGDASEVAFGQNMTTLTYHLSRALGRAWGPGDEIVVTELDHHANVDTWKALERDRGVTIRTVRMDPARGVLDEKDLDAAIGSRTTLVAIGWASNALGTINDVTEICARARAAGALSFVDAVHAAPHILPDVAAIGCDFLACSPYKFYGPHLGVLWGKRALIEALEVPRLVPAPDWSPERLETGTLSHEGIVGAAAAVDFLASLAGPASATRRAGLAAVYTELHMRGRRLFARLWRGLGALDGVRLYGPGPEAPRTPTLSFVVAGRTADEVAEALAARALYLSSGDFYAWTVVERLGHAKDGLVRAGAACYTTDDEVDRLVAAVGEIARTPGR